MYHTTQKRVITSVFVAIAAVVLASVLVATPVGADGGSKRRHFNTFLSGLEEVPAIVTGARGAFFSQLKDGRLHYVLVWQGLEGGDPAGAAGAHIHIGQRGANGAVMAFLCGGPLPPCADGRAEGSIGPDDVGLFGSAGQGVGPGEFDDFLTALRSGRAYVNLHTPGFPGGELRGQLR